jgi:DNA invertase Pin-like site-specific DNA recombinase
MPAKRKYLPQSSTEKPAIPGSLPLDRAIAVYYRQSSMKQVGNISTDMQQIDLPRYAHSLGWPAHEIILIDEDEGVSGAKRIDERKGMSRLFDLIITGRIGSVAAQAEDRLFRDETQIQVNVFIDACVKNDVRVITPYFKYNFADKHEGPYHRLLFRMRAEQAADFLNSYVRGRLFAAKERMLMQGMWMGGNINLGFMVDNRKQLSSGVPNPHWRKFQPYAPCAEVVVKLFELFVSLGGNIRATLRHAFENGPHFPDFDDPDFQRNIPVGFTCEKPVRMLKRGNRYAPSSVALVTMLTNPIYLGHWMHKDRVVVWDNHPPIVTEELFYKAFNYLSPYTLTGEPNGDYAPRLGRLHSTKKKQHTPPKAIFAGLLGSYHEGKWQSANVAWRKDLDTYAYICYYRDLADCQQWLWSRHCDYFDSALTEMLHAKLRATFDPAVWDQVLASAGEDFESERRLLRHQLASAQQKMDALLANFSFVQSQTLLNALETEYANYDEERARLEQKLAALEKRVEKQDALIALAQQAEQVLSTWNELDVEAQRSVAQAFITRIVITIPARNGVARAEICWRDNTSDMVEIAHRADGSTVWFTREVETLTRLIDEGADQVTMSASLPNRNWHAIRLKAYEIIGARNFRISPKPIRDEEKYGDYLARVERDGEKANKTSGNRWTDEELTILEQLVDEEATQLQICAALPVRTWEAIRKKIVKLRGNSAMVKDVGALELGETIHDYLARKPDAATALAMPILENSERRRRCSSPSPPPPASAQAAPAWQPG